MTSEKISILALIVSCIALFISWRGYERDRNKLKITAEFVLESDQGTAFKVHLVNKGRRSINIEKILLRLKSDEVLIPRMDIPRVVLDENEPCNYWFPLILYQNEINSPLDVKRAEAYDSHGKKYSFPFSRLKKQIIKEWTPKNDWLSKSK